MSIAHRCPTCRMQFRVADTLAGRLVRCPTCTVFSEAPGSLPGERATSLPPRPIPKGAKPLPPAPPRRRVVREMAPATAFAVRGESGRAYAVDDDSDASLVEVEASGRLAEDEVAAWVTPAATLSTAYAAPTELPLPPSRSMRPRRLVKPVHKPALQFTFLDVDKSLHRWVAMIGLVVYALGGICLGGFGYLRGVEDRRFNQVAQHVDGKLFDQAVRNDKQGTGRRTRALRFEAYDVKYYFNFNGRQYTGKAKQIAPADLPNGADVTRPFDDQNLVVDVSFDPGHPEDNRLGAAQTWVDWLLMAVGAGILLSGVGGFWTVFRYDRYVRAMAT